ncbi:hypothetical protein B0H13DRAFT_1584710, partial [Mycena leptocephala]
FSDEDLVVQSQNRQFHVRESAVAQASLVLKDTTEVGAYMQGTEVEGCPVLWLPDSPIDVGHILRSVFHRLSYLEDVQTPIPFETIAALLRLGHKYKMKTLFGTALFRLTRASPSTLADYTQHTAADTPFRLANELRLHFLLPVAFWVVCMHIDYL